MSSYVAYSLVEHYISWLLVNSCLPPPRSLKLASYELLNVYRGKVFFYQSSSAHTLKSLSPEAFVVV